jgi:hypothetical protein
VTVSAASFALYGWKFSITEITAPVVLVTNWDTELKK